MITLQEVEFKSFKKCLLLSNGVVELIITVGFGPRILSYRRVDGGVNFMKNFDNEIENFSEDCWQNYGGHRLWIAPEIFPRTYYPDTQKVEYDFDGKTLHLVCETETTTRLQKEIFITLLFNSSKVVLKHRIYNRHTWGVKFAPWCLTVMAPNGRLVVPQEPYVPHGSNAGESFDPARPLILWQFTKMGDPRFTWGNYFIQMRQDDRYASKQKFGMTNKLGYAMYALERELFVKHFDYDSNATYTDLGCNAEYFTMPGFLEIESLGALKNVEPNEYSDLNETWEIFDIDLSEDDEKIREQIAEIV